MSKIEWTHKTWNPTVGCNKVSRGCKNCYAEIMHRRLMALYPKKYQRPFLDGAYEYPEALEIPFEWKKPAMVFVDSMSDLFHDNISVQYIAKVFAIMAVNPHLTFQVLTKRPERMLQFLFIKDIVRPIIEWEIAANYSNHYFKGFTWPLPNVWLGTSVENQEAADERIPFLLRVPAAVRFLSCEPLLSEIDFRDMLSPLRIKDPSGGWFNAHGIDWVIAGGESGNNAQPMHPDWVRSIRDQCEKHSTPFFFKQWGEWMPITMPLTSSQIAILPQAYASSKRKFYQSPDGDEYYKGGKSKTGNKIDGAQHLEFPTIK